MDPDSMTDDQAREEVSSSSTNLPYMKRIRIPEENLELRDDHVSCYVPIQCFLYQRLNDNLMNMMNNEHKYLNLYS